MNLGIVALIAVVAAVVLLMARVRRKEREAAERKAVTPEINLAEARLRGWEIPGESAQRPAPRPVRPKPAIVTSGASNGLVLEYADAYGVLTERQIRGARVEKWDDTIYIDAVCQLRGQRRNFRADRVQRLWTPQGEPIADPLTYLTGLARGARPILVVETPPEHKRAMGRVRPTLLALIWIARTDGDVDAAEMAVLLDYIDARLATGRGKDVPVWDRHLAATAIDEAAPIKAQAVKALLDIAADSPQAALFRDFADRVVGSDGSSDARKANRRAQLLKVWG